MIQPSGYGRHQTSQSTKACNAKVNSDTTGQSSMQQNKSGQQESVNVQPLGLSDMLSSILQMIQGSFGQLTTSFDGNLNPITQTTEVDQTLQAAQTQASQPDESSIHQWNQETGLEGWVTTLYENILGREPENQETVDYWTNKAVYDGPVSVLKEFFNSQELKNKGLSAEDTAELMYRSILSRHAEPAGKAAWAKGIQDGIPMDYLVESFTSGEEYKAKGEQGIIPQDSSAYIPKWKAQDGTKGWVTTLYENILGREPENQDVVNTWAQNAEKHGKAFVLEKFFSSAELKSKNLSTEQTVELLYRSILYRPAEPKGKAGWVKALQDGLSLPEVINRFVDSPENQANIAKGTSPSN
jgi:hypothetical protein